MPAGEAERQRVGRERLGDRLDGVGILAAEQPILDGLRLDVVDEQASRLVARGPQLGVRDLVDRRPRRGLGGACEPAVAEVAVEQDAAAEGRGSSADARRSSRA